MALTIEARAEQEPQPLSFLEEYPVVVEYRKQGKIPFHVALIPDGNGTWAERRGLERCQGHIRGGEVAMDRLRDLSELKKQPGYDQPGQYVGAVTMWLMSLNNLSRPREEVSFLETTFDSSLEKYYPEFMSKGIRVLPIGRRDNLDPRLVETMEMVEEGTARNTDLILVLPIAFDGNDQDLRVTQKAVDFGRETPYLKDPITKDFITSSRDGGGLVGPADLLLRTAQQRLSGVGWLGSGDNTEVLFLPGVLWPDFNRKRLADSLRFYSRVERKFGGLPNANPSATS